MYVGQIRPPTVLYICYTVIRVPFVHGASQNIDWLSQSRSVQSCANLSRVNIIDSSPCMLLLMLLLVLVMVILLLVLQTLTIKCPNWWSRIHTHREMDRTSNVAREIWNEWWLGDMVDETENSELVWSKRFISKGVTVLLFTVLIKCWLQVIL